MLFIWYLVQQHCWLQGTNRSTTLSIVLPLWRASWLIATSQPANTYPNNSPSLRNHCCVSEIPRHPNPYSSTSPWVVNGRVGNASVPQPSCAAQLLYKGFCSSGGDLFICLQGRVPARRVVVPLHPRARLQNADEITGPGQPQAAAQVLSLQPAVFQAPRAAL